MRAARRLAVLFLAAGAFRVVQNMALTTFALLGRERLGMVAGLLGLIGTLAAAAGAATTMLIASRVPARRSAAWAAGGFVALAAGVLAAAVAPGVGGTAGRVLLIGGILTVGGAAGVALPAAATAVGSAGGGQRDRVLASYALVLSASLAVGPALESGVLGLAHQSLTAPFFSFLALAAVGTLGFVVAARARPGSGSARVGASPLAGPTSAAATGELAGSGTGEAGGHSEAPRLLATAGGRLALTAQLLYSVPFTGITVFGAPLARSVFGVSPAGTQVAFTVFFVASLTARSLLVWRSPLRRKTGVLRGAAVLTVSAILVLGLGHGLAALLIGMALFGIPHGLTFPLVLALVADAVPVPGLARATATIFATTNVAAVVVPALLGLVVQLAGYRAMDLVLLVPVVVTGAVLVRQPEPAPR